MRGTHIAQIDIEVGQCKLTELQKAEYSVTIKMGTLFKIQERRQMPQLSTNIPRKV